jgi:site-specific recombinase XerC
VPDGREHDAARGDLGGDEHATKLAQEAAIQFAKESGATDEEAAEEAKKVRPIIGGPHRARHTYASHFLKAKADL